MSAHPVVDVEDLALPQQLPPHRFRHGPLVVLAHIGEDRLPVGRWRVQQSQVPDSGQAHLEGPRNGGGGQRKHVDTEAQLLDRLLVADAEALLLVDDEEAQVLELDVRREQTVGADHDVDRPVRQAVADRLGLAGGEEPGEHLDPDRVAGEAVPEGLEML